MNLQDIISLVAIVIIGILGTYFNYKFNHIDENIKKQNQN